jgi:hypothetical protein
MAMRLKRLVLLAPVAVVACVEPPAQQPRPAPPPVARPVPTPPPAAPVANWSDRAPAAGVWTYTRDSRGSIARFGQAGSDAQFTIRCDASGARIFVSRPGSVPAKMTLRSTNGAKAYDALPTGGQPPYVAAQLAARDAQLDAMAFSRGRILIGLDGAPDLILPIWPEFTRVVEDCRG